MKNAPHERNRTERFSMRLAALILGLQPSTAHADWGEDWVTMLWGSGRPPTPAVPTLDDWGLLLLPAVLITAALLIIAKRRAPRTTLVLLVALFVPLVGYAATISMPYVFTNGTVADATQVNANFDELVLESNDQDLRLSIVEGLTGPHTHLGTDITSQVGDADTVDGTHAVALEESAEIDADIAAHAAVTSSHHTRYSDAEALLAAVGVDAGTLDGLDSAVLEESAEIDADIATHGLNQSAHHTRYTDVEALVAAAGVDAGTLDGLDSLDFAAASHTHAYGNVAIVAQSGGDYNDPKTAMDNLATWCGIASATNPCLVRIMPGIYDLGNNALTMQSYVDIEGSGENTTVVTSTHSSGTADEASATLVGADDAEARFLAIENLGGSSFAIAIFTPASASPKITNVTATASGGTTFCYGTLNDLGSSPTLTNVESTASGGSRSFGVNNHSGSVAILTNVIARGSGGVDYNYGVGNSSASPIMTNVTAVASGGSSSYGVLSSSSSPIMTNITASASGGLDINHGVHNVGSSPIMTNVTATATGGTTETYGVSNTLSSSPTMTNVTATGSGGTTNGGIYNDGSSAPILRGVSSNGIAVYSASEYQFDSPKTDHRYITATEFELRIGSPASWSRVYLPAAYAYSGTDSLFGLYASIQLPGGADLTEMSCYYMDDAPTDEIEQLDFSLYSAAISDTTFTVLADVNADPANFDDTIVRSVTDSSVSGTGDPVDNNSFSYTVLLTFQRSLDFDPAFSIRFYGCKISYEATSLGFP